MRILLPNQPVTPKDEPLLGEKLFPGAARADVSRNLIEALQFFLPGETSELRMERMGGCDERFLAVQDRWIR